MNFRLVLGYLVALTIGIVCRLSGIPLPAPPAIVGALVVVSMTCGYVFIDKIHTKSKATQIDHCGGPQI